MGIAVCSGATLLCNYGLAPSRLVVLRPRNFSGRGLAANIMDHRPLIHVWPFGLCRSLGNPAVAAATAQTGVLTPMPCSPWTPLPWSRHRPNVLVHGKPALDSTSSLLCGYGGLIRIMFPGQWKETLV